MPQADHVRASGDGSAITIDVSPGAARTEITGVNEWRHAIQVRVAAEPREGRANEELLAFLSERLGVPSGSIRIVKGERSGMKVVTAPLPPDEVRRRLGVP